MKHPPLSPALRAAGVLVSLSILVVSPAYGQSCTPSAESGEAARSGASLTNPAGTTIVVRRRGERGLDATASATNHGTVIACGEVHEFLGDDGSPARRRAHAVSAESESGRGATALNSGLIETRGRGARGMNVWEYGETATATATATNRGRIVTRGDLYDGSAHFGHPHIRTTDGLLAETGRNAGDAIVLNERNSANDPQSGVIEVHGTGARGMWVWTIGTGEAKGINRGSITTHGDAFGGPGSYESAAAGIAAQSSRGSATALNEEGATIRTHGDGAPGLFAGIRSIGENGAGSRTARAENHGTIVVSGDSVFGEEEYEWGLETDIELYAAGVYAHADDGAATVINTGTVTAAGRFAVGLYAGDGSSVEEEYYGMDVVEPTVTATVTMTGGNVTAGTRDDPATPQDERRLGIGILAESERGQVRVTVSGDSTTVTAHSGNPADPLFEDEYEDDHYGIGIVTDVDTVACVAGASNVAVGRCAPDSIVEVSGGATVTADIAVVTSGTLNVYESRLNGGVELGDYDNVFTIRGGSVHGNVDFEEGNDVLTIRNHGYVSGNLEFDDGTDTLVIDVNGTGDRTTRIDGAITGLEEMYKRGPGTAWVRDVTFSGSTLALEEGGLTLAGHLNLGTDGTLTVHDESRLTIEVGDITRDATDHGRITAGGGVIYEGLATQDSPELFMQIGADAADNRDAIQARLQQEETRIDVLGQDTNVLRRADADSQSVAAEATLMTVGDDGTAQTIGTLSDDGTAVVQCPEGQVGTPPNCTTPPPPMCPEGQVGTPPDCTTPEPPMCPAGQVGTPPDCTTPEPPMCPAGQVGTPPDCTTPEPPMCPAGQVGTPPDCTTPEPPMCPAGQVGTPPDCKTPPRGDDGGSSNAGAILVGGGAAAALAVYLFDLFDSEEPALAEYDETWTGSRSTTSFAGIRSGHFREHRVRTGAVEQWTRAFAGDSSALAGGVEGAVQGVALGMDAKLPGGFSVGVSMMPDVAVSARRGPALNFGANVEGGRYALRGGWRADALFVDTNLSHGSYRTHSLIENPAAGGLLGGELGFTQSHTQGRAGMRLDLGGLRATPSVALFAGSLRQDAYTARGAAVSAQVPGISQRYAGWRAKLDLAPSGWLDGPGALHWRPSLHLGTTRTHTSGPTGLDVRQSDREGVLSFTSRATVKALPRTVHGIGASLVAARSDAWNFRIGYAGMVVDGEPVHAAVARVMIRF